jgi:hypothetical protein
MKYIASSPVFLNWKRVPAGIERETPTLTSSIVSVRSSFRQTSPKPDKKYQISSTFLCVTALDMQRGGSVQWHNPPFCVRANSLIFE